MTDHFWLFLMLLSLPGIAIVDLPELSLLICSGCMRYMSYCTKSPCDERAALLAAANAAEQARGQADS